MDFNTKLFQDVKPIISLKEITFFDWIEPDISKFYDIIKFTPPFDTMNVKLFDFSGEDYTTYDQVNTLILKTGFTPAPIQYLFGLATQYPEVFTKNVYVICTESKSNFWDGLSPGCAQMYFDANNNQKLLSLVNGRDLGQQLIKTGSGQEIRFTHLFIGMKNS